MGKTLNLRFMTKPPHQHAKRIFNFIAPVYASLDSFIRLVYKRAFRIINSEIDLKSKSVLDIGTGSGVWAALFKEHGAEKVHGIDIAERMIKRAKIRYSPEIEFSLTNGTDFKQFRDNSFDIVTSSLVLHGMKKNYREEILSEMQRISKKHVIINDFYGKTPVIIQFLEYLEQSDYKHFKKYFLNEINDKFNIVKRKDASLGTSVYFASKSEAQNNMLKKNRYKN